MENLNNYDMIDDFRVEDLISEKIVDLKMYDTTPEHAKEYGLQSINPLYIQTICVSEPKRLKGLGKKVLAYIDKYAIENGHDVVFGHITQKAKFTKDERETSFCDIDIIKNWLYSNGYAINNNNNDFFKVISNNNPDIRYAKGGSVLTLLAPNGKPSNLDAEQYNLVRTPEFKAWFGDWENDPANASKVVDENGEPLVVYHGTKTNRNFNVFDNTKFGNQKRSYKNGYFFTNNYEVAKSFSKSKPIVFEVFLNIRKPKKINFKGANWEGYDDNDNQKVDYDLNTLVSIWSSPFLKKDGLIAHNIYDVGDYWNGDNPIGNNYIVFKSEQIKLADGSNTTFDGSNPDIRYAKGGSLPNSLHIIIENVNPEKKHFGQYKKIFDIIEKDIVFYNPYGTDDEKIIGNDFHIWISPIPDYDKVENIKKLKGVKVLSNYYADGGSVKRYNKQIMKKVKKGGITYGNSHAEGGIKVKNASTGDMLEVEGGEGIVNKRSMASDRKVILNGNEMTICEAVSSLNQIEGGVQFNCDDVSDRQFIEEMARGGELERGTRTEKEHIQVLKDLYAKRITPNQATKRIAKDHIKEDSRYYSKLAKMEGKMAKGGKVSDVIVPMSTITYTETHPKIISRIDNLRFALENRETPYYKDKIHLYENELNQVLSRLPFTTWHLELKKGENKFEFLGNIYELVKYTPKIGRFVETKWGIDKIENNNPDTDLSKYGTLYQNGSWSYDSKEKLISSLNYGFYGLIYGDWSGKILPPQKMAKGGKIADINNLEGSIVKIYEAGVKDPIFFVVKSAKMSDPNFRYKTLTLTSQDGYVEEIQDDKIEPFLRGEEVSMQTRGKYDFYVLKLTDKKMKLKYGGKTEDCGCGLTYADGGFTENKSPMSEGQIVYIIEPKKPKNEWLRGVLLKLDKGNATILVTDKDANQYEKIVPQDSIIKLEIAQSNPSDFKQFTKDFNESKDNYFSTITALGIIEEKIKKASKFPDANPEKQKEVIENLKKELAIAEKMKSQSSSEFSKLDNVPSAFYRYGKGGVVEMSTVSSILDAIGVKGVFRTEFETQYFKLLPTPAIPFSDLSVPLSERTNFVGKYNYDRDKLPKTTIPFEIEKIGDTIKLEFKISTRSIKNKNISWWDLSRYLYKIGFSKDNSKMTYAVSNDSPTRSKRFTFYFREDYFNLFETQEDIFQLLRLFKILAVMLMVEIPFVALEDLQGNTIDSVLAVFKNKKILKNIDYKGDEDGSKDDKIEEKINLFLETYDEQKESPKHFKPKTGESEARGILRTLAQQRFISKDAWEECVQKAKLLKDLAEKIRDLPADAVLHKVLMPKIVEQVEFLTQTGTNICKKYDNLLSVKLTDNERTDFPLLMIKIWEHEPSLDSSIFE